jgi:hypothetical protein
MAQYVIMTEAERATFNAGLPPDEWATGYWAETPTERKNRERQEKRWAADAGATP